jgi:Na/Pi-cotransporter
VTALQTAFAALSAVILFLYALKGFRREIQEVGGAKLDAALRRMTSSRWRAFAVGALATALVQSSSAVSSMTVSFVDAGLLQFRASLGVALGAKVGTTSTAWLVAFKLTGIGPVFIVLGAIVSAIPFRYRLLGQTLFYFGLIFFALDLISASLMPLRENALMQQALSSARNPWMGVVLGALITVVFQSSSVTTGLAILLVQQGMLAPESAVPIAIGSNAGTPSTALIVSAAMSPAARATAWANLFFNVCGVLAISPFLRPFSSWVIAMAGGAGSAVALAHLLFNVGMSMAFLFTLPRVAPVFEKRFRLSAPAAPVGYSF